MKIIIVGAGAMGMLFYSQLKLQQQVGFYNTNTNVDPLDNIVVTNLRGLSKSISASYIDSSDVKSADCILFCLKSYDILNAIRSMPALSQQTHLVLMHNGMGVKEEIENQLKLKNPIYTLLTTQASRRLNKHHVMHTGFGINQLGIVKNENDSTQFFLNAFTQALKNTSYSDSLPLVQWTKLAVNCAINPLTAIHDIPNGSLNNERYRLTIARITTEVVNIAKLEGLSLNYKEIIELIYTVMSNTAQNSSSMREDIRNQRKTEVGYISGYIKKLGQKHNYPTPENDRMYKDVQSIENSYF